MLPGLLFQVSFLDLKPAASFPYIYIIDLVVVDRKWKHYADAANDFFHLEMGTPSGGFDGYAVLRKHPLEIRE